MTTRADSFQRLETMLGRVLLAGVVSSAIALAAGLALWVFRGASPLASAMLTAGLMILMATPIMRVLVSLVAYVRMRDWFFATMTVLVFALLAVTVTLAWLKAG